VTPLVAGGAVALKQAKSGNLFGPRFHWIDDVEMIKDFKQFRPWYKVIEVLDSVPTPAAANATST
jgi:hypothetical protein